VCEGKTNTPCMALSHIISYNFFTYIYICYAHAMNSPILVMDLYQYEGFWCGPYALEGM
jgi:hypothetical protein